MYISIYKNVHNNLYNKQVDKYMYQTKDLFINHRTFVKFLFLTKFMYK